MVRTLHPLSIGGDLGIRSDIEFFSELLLCSHAPPAMQLLQEWAGNLRLLPLIFCSLGNSSLMYCGEQGGRVWLSPLANDSFSCHIVFIVDTLVRWNYLLFFPDLKCFQRIFENKYSLNWCLDGSCILVKNAMGQWPIWWLICILGRFQNLWKLVTKWKFWMWQPPYQPIEHSEKIS